MVRLRRVVGAVALVAGFVLGLSGVAHAAARPTPDHTPTEANDEARRLAKIDAGQGASSDTSSTGTAPGDPQSSQDTQPPPGSQPPRSSPSLSIPPAVAWSIAGVVGAILIYLLIKSFAGRAQHTKIVDPDSDDSNNDPTSELRDELTPTERIRPGDAWRKRAVDHERSGEWRLAVRARFRGLLVDLADQGVVTEARGKTVGEYRGDVVIRQPEVAQPFDAAADLFEGAWYGPDEPTQTECDRIAQESTAILAASK